MCLGSSPPIGFCLPSISTCHSLSPNELKMTIITPTMSSCYETHVLSEDGKPSLRILRPTQPHQPRVLHARYGLDQDTRSLCSASLRVWRYFVYSYLPPPEKYRSHCTHDMLWITKRKIFYSLNEGSMSICYQTHINSALTQQRTLTHINDREH